MIDKLKKWINAIQKAIIGVIAIQTILVIIIGIASNKVSNSFDIWAWIILGASLIYIFLVIVMTAYQITFPGSIADELFSKKKLIEQEKFLDRQNSINKYITESLKSLNEQTCTIDNSGESNILCDQVLEIRLNDLLKTLVDYTDVIMDTHTTKNFTVGLYLQEYYKRPQNIDDIILDYIGEEVHFNNREPIIDKGILVLKDELNLREELLPKELIEIPDATAARFEIQSSIKRSYNNRKFDKHEFIHNGLEYTILCSEIPEVCSDDYAIGVLFIISRKVNNIPSDIEEILRIYDRLISNYTAKYDNCIFDHVVDLKMKKDKRSAANI